jgi:hypothetical protein
LLAVILVATLIYKGEIIWTSQTGQSSGQTTGAYGGVSQEVGGRSGTTVHGGTYGAKHTGEHSSENWTQCGWCYDQWLAEIVAHEKWEDKKPFWPYLLIIPFAVIGYFIGKATGKSGGETACGVFGFIIGFGIASVIISVKAGKEPPKPDRYRFRIRK